MQMNMHYHGILKLVIYMKDYCFAKISVLTNKYIKIQGVSKLMALLSRAYYFNFKD